MAIQDDQTRRYRFKHDVIGVSILAVTLLLSALIWTLYNDSGDWFMLTVFIVLALGISFWVLSGRLQIDRHQVHYRSGLQVACIPLDDVKVAFFESCLESRLEHLGLCQIELHRGKIFSLNLNRFPLDATADLANQFYALGLAFHFPKLTKFQPHVSAIRHQQKQLRQRIAYVTRFDPILRQNPFSAFE